MTWEPFNLNRYWRIKILPIGEKMWEEHWLSFGIQPPAIKRDEDGYTKMQAHEVCNIFGPRMVNGMNQPIETTVLLEWEK